LILFEDGDENPEPDEAQGDHQQRD